MIGPSLSAFTTLHVVLSLVGIVASAIMLVGLIGNKWRDGWTVLFLAATAATSATGFLFPFKVIGPSYIVGAISLAALAAALFALYSQRLAGSWRLIYIGCAVLALYLNVFVGVVQAFQKFSFLNGFAPTQSEPPFVATQAILLLLFIGLGALALKNFQSARQ
jgi:hypothetical protein